MTIEIDDSPSDSCVTPPPCSLLTLSRLAVRSTTYLHTRPPAYRHARESRSSEKRRASSTLTPPTTATNATGAKHSFDPVPRRRRESIDTYLTCHSAWTVSLVPTKSNERNERRAGEIRLPRPAEPGADGRGLVRLVGGGAARPIINGESEGRGDGSGGRGGGRRIALRPGRTVLLLRARRAGGRPEGSPPRFGRPARRQRPIRGGGGGGGEEEAPDRLI